MKLLRKQIKITQFYQPKKIVSQTFCMYITSIYVYESTILFYFGQKCDDTIHLLWFFPLHVSWRFFLSVYLDSDCPKEWVYGWFSIGSL